MAIGLIAAAGGLGQIAVVGILLTLLAAVLYASGMLLQKVSPRHMTKDDRHTRSTSLLV